MTTARFLLESSTIWLDLFGHRSLTRLHCRAYTTLEYDSVLWFPCGSLEKPANGRNYSDIVNTCISISDTRIVRQCCYFYTGLRAKIPACPVKYRTPGNLTRCSWISCCFARGFKVALLESAIFSKEDYKQNSCLWQVFEQYIHVRVPLRDYCHWFDMARQRAAAWIWFEIWGGRGSG